nr:MAG TPA: hypothetical protein [Caudoviricetes sp.]
MGKNIFCRFFPAPYIGGSRHRIFSPVSRKKLS